MGDYASVLRKRWKLIVAILVACVLAATGISLLITPRYESTAQLFVSSAVIPDENLVAVYQGGLYAQGRVTSYAQIIKSTVLAQQAIDANHLSISASDLSNEVTTKVVNETVLLDLTVTDSSPTRARDYADALATQFIKFVSELETPPGGTVPTARVVVVQPAVAADSAASPNTVGNIGFAAVLGLLLGVAAAIVRERLISSTGTASKGLHERPE
jgi:capsular polysaccharide biosynthesis protein